MGCLKLNIENPALLRVLNGGKSAKPKSRERSYWFGYNGMEKDPEIKGDGNSYTTEFRQYDPRLGRWLSLDPLMRKFPWMSPYVAFDNNPVYYIDPYGLESGTGKDEIIDGDPPMGDGGTSECDDGARVASNVIASGKNTAGVGPDMGSGNLDYKSLNKKLYGTEYPSEGSLMSMRMNLSDDKLFKELYELGDNFADDPKSKAMIKGLIDHFKENKGTNYSSQFLTDAAAKHPSTVRFIGDITDAFKDEMEENKEYNDNFKLILAGNPRFNEKGYIFSGDEDNGLLISVNDVWDYEVKVVSYKEVEGKYYAEIQLVLYDHFGLDELDITDHIYSDIYPEFNSWFILQWCRNYKPFVTVMHIPTFTISGSIPNK